MTAASSARARRTARVAPPPILVLAPPGVAAQEVAACLGRNPAAWDLPELHLEEQRYVEGWLLDLSGPRAALSHGLMRGLCHLLAGEQSLGALDMARRFLMNRLHLTTAELAHEILARAAPCRLVIPASLPLLDQNALERLAEIFPEADVVVPRMHPLTHADTLMARFDALPALLLGAIDRTGERPKGDPPGLLRAAEQGLDSASFLWPGSRIVECRLEDLATRPGPTLKELAEALDLPAGRNAVTAMRHPERSPFVGPGPLGAHTVSEIEPLDILKARLRPRETPLDSALGWRPGTLPEDIQALARAQGYGLGDGQSPAGASEGSRPEDSAAGSA